MILIALVLAAQPQARMDEPILRRMAAQFAPTEVGVPLDGLPQNERAALGRIVAAARILDAVYLRQAWAQNPALLMDLVRDASPVGRARLQLFLINKGPWSNVDHDVPFVPGVGPRPESANFYPPDSTKQDIEAWQKSLDGPAREAATSFFTTIRRTPDGKLTPVPYSVEYQGELFECAKLLREAARLTGQPTLRRFLETRAAAFASNDYYDSDVAWMELDASIEPTIGPYEVYTDRWFNQKAAFEAFVTLRDDGETKKVAQLGAELQDIENHLPIDPALRNPKIGGLTPIRVVNEIFASGDANHGVQSAAYNLPNDERILRERGSKRVMLRNVQEAKFRKVLLPIAQVALAPADRPAVSFDAFFTQILMHELMHGLGPHQTQGGTTVRQAMQEAGSALEEAKADISGLFALQYLVDKGALSRELERTMFVTFLASAFRSIRFGVEEPHGKGVALQLNALLDAGAVRIGADGTFAVVPGKIREAVAALTREIMTVQHSGDAGRARELLARRGVVRPEVQRVLDKLRDVPVDIAPIFTTADRL